VIIKNLWTFLIKVGLAYIRCNKEKENVMKNIIKIVLSLLVTVSYALASEGSKVEGLGLMATFFIAFGVMIVIFQFIPGLLLLSGMLKGIFSTSVKKVPVTNSK
jgi:hypothetical protein